MGEQKLRFLPMRQTGAKEQGKELTTRSLLLLPSPISFKKLNRTQTKTGASQPLATPGKLSSPARQHTSQQRRGEIGARQPSMVRDNSAGHGTRAFAPRGFKQSVPYRDIPPVTHSHGFSLKPPQLLAWEKESRTPSAACEGSRNGEALCAFHLPCCLVQALQEPAGKK